MEFWILNQLTAISCRRMRESQQEFSGDATLPYISCISGNGRSTLLDEPTLTFQCPWNETTALPSSKDLVVEDPSVSCICFVSANIQPPTHRFPFQNTHLSNRR